MLDSSKGVQILFMSEDFSQVSFGIGVGLVTSAALLMYHGACALLQRYA